MFHCIYRKHLCQITHRSSSLKKIISTHILLLSFFLHTQYIYAQEFVDNLIDFFTIQTNPGAVREDSSIYPGKVVLAPVVIFSPETNFGAGVGAKYLFKSRGSGNETRTSNMPVSAIYTIENQFILFSGFEIFSNQEKWMLTGNAILKDFPQLYYGVGRDTPESNEEEFSFFQLLLEPILLKRMFTRYFFLGGGIRYNQISNVEAVEGGLLENTQTPGALGFTSVGAEVAFVYDSRSNLINSAGGWYAEFTHGFYGKALGGTQEFQLTRLDLRYYTQPFKLKEDVLAFQLKLHMSHGNTPLGELASFGGGEILRGYYEGRFIAKHLAAFQAEYRRNIVGRLGGVVFAGLGGIGDGIEDFGIGNFRYNFGVGLRFLLDNRENLNIRLDWGFGKNTNNYYLNIAEAF